jgi:glutathione-regulated potassium-efflux system ancillary protein KefG
VSDSPSLLKEWQDVVPSYGWAYRTDGTYLRGKKFMLAIYLQGDQKQPIKLVVLIITA